MLCRRRLGSIAGPFAAQAPKNRDTCHRDCDNKDSSDGIIIGCQDLKHLLRRVNCPQLGRKIISAQCYYCRGIDCWRFPSDTWTETLVKYVLADRQQDGATQKLEEYEK